MTADDEQGPMPETHEEVEIVDAVPVPQGPLTVDAVPEPPARGALTLTSPVVVQVAAVAVTGFAAGAATVAVVRRRRRRRRLHRGKGRKAIAEIRASRSFLVDVHLLGARDT